MTVKLDVFAENTSIPHRVQVVYQQKDQEGNWKEIRRHDLIQGFIFTDYIWNGQRLLFEEVKA